MTELLQEIKEKQQKGYAVLGLFAAHPTRLRYKVFWDVLNFANGQNTDPADYRFAPQRDNAAYVTGLRNLRRTIQAIRDLPGVELISVRSLNDLFTPGTGSIGWDDVRRLAQEIADNEAIRADNPLASPAQALDVLARATLYLADGQQRPDNLLLRDVLGPINPPPPLEQPITIPFQNALAIFRDLVGHVDATGHLPTTLATGDAFAGPGPLLRLLSTLFLDLDRGSTPEQVTLSPGAEEPEIAARLADEAIYKRLPGWEPHSPDLELDKLALHTRLQSWSLKPAVLASK
ncbi:MAG: hypothetical protein J7M34_03150 [Anaerolineae bacterium]|nr:hypothetical protein [Anaerolineae bacterium]